MSTDTIMSANSSVPAGRSIVAVVSVDTVKKCQFSTFVVAVLVNPNSYSCVLSNVRPVKLNFILPLLA